MHQSLPAERYFSGNPALPVAQACQLDDAEGVVQALQTTRVSPDAVGEQGMSLLLLAIGNHSKKAMLALLTHGANPNLQTELGRAKHLMQPVAGTAKGDDTELLRVLLDHGGDPNSRYGKQSALCGALDAQRYDNLRLLLDHGANFNVPYTDNASTWPPNPNLENVPLTVHLAAMGDFEPLVVLIERGADVYTPDKFGNTVASELQRIGFNYEPGYYRYPWMLKAKRLLEAKGIHFPVPDPLISRRAKEQVENARRRQWETTPAGRSLVASLRQAERARELTNTTENYERIQVLSRQAEEAFQVWYQTQPNWMPTVNSFPESYQHPPGLAQEEKQLGQQRVHFQADSARWAEQAKALR